MRLSHRFIIPVLALTAFTAGGCSKSPSPTQTQIHKVLEIGSRLNSATEAGLNYSEFRQSVLDYFGALNLALEMWPKEMSQDAKQNLIDAGAAWRFSLVLWAEEMRTDKLTSLNVKGISAEMAESELKKLPDKFRGDFPLSDGYRYEQSSNDGIPKHLSYTVTPRALGLASNAFKEARSELVAFLR